ncbi:hypothetical protein FNV43_RR27119 [Rhamnella rubrinervis]|uniref:Uncharacterized protein n=1 Tax=Rhamnella rubrinervis TaxID=2594499 RepID=A0A8K0DQP1_9ROSA|nr:hypothetical protein FNV43_RR27119 [Rhamnella rubrinervis]
MEKYLCPWNLELKAGMDKEDFLLYFACLFYIIWTGRNAILMEGGIDLKALRIDNILGFNWPASPSPEVMFRVLEVLYSLGGLDDDVKLTFHQLDFKLLRLH